MVCVVWQGGAGIRDSEHEENAALLFTARLFFGTRNARLLADDSVALVISSGLRLFKTHKKDGFNLISRNSHKNSC